MKPSPLGWFLLSLLIGLVSFVLYSRHVSAPQLANDSYQYLDAASHLKSGSCLCTDVAHFDEQLKWGRMPIPFTHFGPGYPVLIAALAMVGLSVETAGYLLSAIGFLSVLCFISLIGYYLDLPPWSITLVCVVWALNSNALDFGVSVATDCLFTALLTGVCALLAYDVRNLNRPRPLILLAMGALTGFGYWLRQPGLFLFLPLCLYLAWRLAVDRRSSPYALAGVIIAALLMAPITVRNILLTHSWNSGFANGRHTPWKAVVADTLKAPYHILFGDTAVARFDPWLALFAMAAFFIGARAFANWRRVSASACLDESSRTILGWVAIYAVTFAAGILAAEFSTYAASEVRYNFPIFPLLLVICAALFQLAGDRLGRTAALACVLAVVVVNARSLFAVRLPDQSSLPADLLQQQVQPGLSMQAYIKRNIPSASVLIATEGQAVYYLLKRPVVSIIEPQYSLHTWNESDVRSVMQSFHSEYFLVFPGAGNIRAPEQQASLFLEALTEGHAPNWLTIAARTPGVILYRRVHS